MKVSTLLFFFLITQFCLAQNNDLIKDEAMMLFNDGKVKEALNTLEQIKDKKTLENTDVNTWKKHFKDILDYKFSEGYVINDSLKTVFIKTSLLTHFGIYNSNTKKYMRASIYDNIPKSDAISKYLVISLNHQKSLIDLSGKTIIPLGNYDIYMNANYKYIAVVSNDINSVKDIYNWDGKLVGNHLSFFQGVNQNYIITQNDLNKFQLLNTDSGLLVIEDCDKIENISYGNENRQEVFIKKDNNYAIYNFVTNTFSARNDFDKIIRNINVFSNYLKGTSTEQSVSEKNRFIILKKSAKSGIYDLIEKKYFIEPVYDSITGFGNCLRNNVWRNIKYEFPIKEDYGPSEAVVYIKNNHFGLKSVSDKTITDAEYDQIVQKTDNLFLVNRQQKVY